MSTKFDDYQKVLANERFHRQMQTGMMAVQTSLALDMSGSLRGIQAQMAQVRQMHEEGLAAQQEMLRMEQFQSTIEEFIYKTEKMIEAYSGGESDVAPSTRYFSLRGVKDTVQQFGLGTPLIRGRENKAAFETAMESVDALLGQLKTNPEVVEALQWAKAEQQRIAEEKQKKEEEDRQAAAEKETRRAQFLQEIERLKATRKKFAFSTWYSQKFGAYLKREPPYDKLPVLSSMSEKNYPLIAAIILWGPLPFGLCYGCVWIPLFYVHAKKHAEDEMNAAVNGEITKLEQQLASLQ